MTTPAPPSTGDDERLPRLIAGILIVEFLAIVGLYWLGAHFTA